MNASYSKSFRSSQSSRSSSVGSNGPRRLKRTRCCGVATVAIGSIWRKPRRRTVSSTDVAEPSRSCARTAIRRARRRSGRSRLADHAVPAARHLELAAPAPAIRTSIGAVPAGSPTGNHPRPTRTTIRRPSSSPSGAKLSPDSSYAGRLERALKRLDRRRHVVDGQPDFCEAQLRRACGRAISSTTFSSGSRK